MHASDHAVIARGARSVVPMRWYLASLNSTIPVLNRLRLVSHVLRVSKLSDYATVLLGLLAEAPARVRPATDLAEAARLELPTVSKVLKMLAAAGLVSSQRGVSGGYRLAQPPADISVAQIVEAIDGPIGMTECSVHQGQCSHETHCGVRSPWLRISQVVVGALRSMTLAEMIGVAPPESTPSPRRQDPRTERIAIRLA